MLKMVRGKRGEKCERREEGGKICEVLVGTEVGGEPLRKPGGSKLESRGGSTENGGCESCEKTWYGESSPRKTRTTLQDKQKNTQMDR